MRTVLVAALLTLLPPAAAVGSLGSTGCLACGDVGVTPGALIVYDFEAAEQYQFVVTADGENVSMFIDRGGTCGNCTAHGERIQIDTVVTMQGAGFRIWLTVAHVNDDGGPATIEVTVFRNGDRFFQETLQPDYQRVCPNGELCGPCADVARIRVPPTI